MKKIWQTYRSPLILLFSMALGGIIGYAWGPGASALQPIADIFLNLLYYCVVPLIFFSLSSAICKMKDLSKLRRILEIFIIGIFASGTVACIFMIIPCLFVNPASGVRFHLSTKGIDTGNSSFNLLSMFTVDDFPKLFSRTNLMALIVFTLLFSFAVIMSGEKGKKVITILDNFSTVTVNLINLVMKIAPLGLGAYFAVLIGKNGSQIVGPLGKTILMYIIFLAIYFIFSQTVYAYIGGGSQGIKRWWQTSLTPTLTALGTCSSAASLPMNLDQGKKIGIPDEIANLVIPLGANLHKDGACMIEILKIALLCSLFHISFADSRNLLLSILVSVVASIVEGAIPSGGYVAEIFIMSAFNFPKMAMPIMILLGTITDAPATLLNVTGDTGLAMLITRFVEGKDWIKETKISD